MALVSPMLLNSSFTSIIKLARHSKPGGPKILMYRINGSPILCSASTTVSPRNSANYQPNLWNYEFLQSLKHDYAEVRHEDRAKKLQEETRRMIKYDNGEIWATLELIDHVKRLGLGYHFEKEIGEALDRFLWLERSSGTFVRRSLHEAALSFRLLREYGYDASPGI